MKANQIIKSYLKGQKAKEALQMKFFLSLMLLFATVAFLGLILDPAHAHACMAGLGGSGFASMMAIGSVDDVSDKYTTGNDIAAKVYLIHIKQINPLVAFPKPNANREVSTLPMLDGEYMQYFESHDYPAYNGKNEKGDATSTGTKTFSFNMGGNRDKLLNFVEEHIGDKFIILFRSIESSSWNIIGSVDSPIVLKSTEVKDDKDGKYIPFTFERSTLNEYLHYVGNIITAPPSVHTADATTLAISAAQDLYSIPDGSAATYAIGTVSGLTATSKGRSITLVGTGTTKAATIADNTTFVLEDGATWTAKAGSKISFRVLDPSTLVEISGSRIQA